MRLMELRQLQSFVAAAEREIVTRAAEFLELTQAAVSQHLGSLDGRRNVNPAGLSSDLR